MMSRKLTRALSMPLARPLIPDSEFVAASAPAPTCATWSPTDKAPNFTLSGSDLIATLTGSGFDSLRANIGKQTGSGTFEIHVPNGDAQNFAGVGTSSAALAGYFCGLDANGWGYFSQTGIFNTGVQYAFGTAWSTQKIMFEVNFTAGTMDIFREGVFLGTRPLAPLTGPIFPMGSAAASGQTLYINCGQSPFSRTPTPGITPYWSADA